MKDAMNAKDPPFTGKSKMTYVLDHLEPSGRDSLWKQVTRHEFATFGEEQSYSYSCNCNDCLNEQAIIDAQIDQEWDNSGPSDDSDSPEEAETASQGDDNYDVNVIGFTGIPPLNTGIDHMNYHNISMITRARSHPRHYREVM